MDDITTTLIEFFNEYLMIANSLEMFRLLLDSGAGYEKSLPTNVYIELEVQVRLCCVPGHSNRAGNKEVDELLEENINSHL